MNAAHDVVVVGAGPAGALAACRLAGAGARVVLFDGSAGREKPCGGGVTPRALREHPEVAGLAGSGRRVARYVFESDRGRRAVVECAAPSVVFERRVLDEGLRRRAEDSGAALVRRAVMDVESSGGRWRLRDSAGAVHVASVLFAADGAGSAIRKRHFPPTPRTGLPCRVAYLDGGGAEDNEVQFPSGFRGYVWTFPRPDHMSVGICAMEPVEGLAERLSDYARRRFGPRRTRDPHRLGGLVPARTPAWPRASALVAGAPVALLGDAAGLADPLTGEGIGPALGSGAAAADAFLRGDLDGYASWVDAAVEPEMALARKACGFFFAPAFVESMLQMAARSASVRRTLMELIQGERGYAGLRRRLLSRLPATVAELARPL